MSNDMDLDAWLSESRFNQEVLDLNSWTRESLLALPLCQGNLINAYDSVLLLSTGDAHPDTGFALIAVIGIRNGRPVEIASNTTDAIEWRLPSGFGSLKMDCAFTSGAIHVWERGVSFRSMQVAAYLNTTLIQVLL